MIAVAAVGYWKNLFAALLALKTLIFRLPAHAIRLRAPSPPVKKPRIMDGAGSGEKGIQDEIEFPA